MDRPLALASGPRDDSGAPVRIDYSSAGTVVTVVEGTPWTPALARVLGDLLGLPRVDDLPAASSAGELAQVGE